jgi:hypothetical protein
VLGMAYVAAVGRVVQVLWREGKAAVAVAVVRVVVARDEVVRSKVEPRVRGGTGGVVSGCTRVGRFFTVTRILVGALGPEGGARWWGQ